MANGSSEFWRGKSKFTMSRGLTEEEKRRGVAANPKGHNVLDKLSVAPTILKKALYPALTIQKHSMLPLCLRYLTSPLLIRKERERKEERRREEGKGKKGGGFFFLLPPLLVSFVVVVISPLPLINYHCSRQSMASSFFLLPSSLTSLLAFFFFLFAEKTQKKKTKEEGRLRDVVCLFSSFLFQPHSILTISCHHHMTRLALVFLLVVFSLTCIPKGQPAFKYNS